jgi:ABC-type polysaccharide/polyol phosphate transport system ATPase subunit
VIGLEGVGVRYRIPHERLASLKEYAIRRLRGRLEYTDLWAVRDVHVSIWGGEIFGVIGSNGAGKSTMLKVMARVLRPTTGRVWTFGRVAPLLEIGAGFHPELTGRENVFLNGVLLGYARRDVDEHLGAIVAFAELGEFIDAPLRTYSTGMVARLGFAVATAIRPSILLVDEVLSVGDEAFQRKCRARFDQFRREGTTTVLVSHNTGTIEHLCTRALWLDGGVVRAIGEPAAVVSAYHAAGA